MRVDVKPDLLLWACERARRSIDTLARQQSFYKLPAWVSGEKRPTFKQLEKFAQATHTPFGYFFLPEPPEESIPIPDLRTVGGTEIRGGVQSKFACGFYLKKVWILFSVRSHRIQNPVS